MAFKHLNSLTHDGYWRVREGFRLKRHIDLFRDKRGKRICDRLLLNGCF